MELIIINGWRKGQGWEIGSRREEKEDKKDGVRGGNKGEREIRSEKNRSKE